jgi:hypothetical protein
MNKLLRKRTLLFLALAGIVVLIVQIAANGNIPPLGKLLNGQLIGFGCVAISLQMVGHWLRAAKHRYMLEQIRPIKTRDVFKGQMIGLLFNAILPFRLGELVRAHYIGKQVSISQSAVFATIVFERWFDAFILLVAAGTLFLMPSWSSALPYVVAVLAGTVVLLGYALYAATSQQLWLLRAVYNTSASFNPTIRDRLRFMAWSGIYSLKSVLMRIRMRRYIAMTAAMWACYGLSMFVFIAGVLPALPFLNQVIAALAVYLGVSVPSGPAYLGTFQGIFASIGDVQNGAISFDLWFLLIVPSAVFGAVFLLQRQKVQIPGPTDTMGVLKNKLYRDADITKEFSNFLDAYFKGDQISRILNAHELTDSFSIIKTFKGGSNALTILAWQDGALVVKKITLKQYESKLRDQYLWLKRYDNLTRITKVLREYPSQSNYYAIDIDYREEYVPFFEVIHSMSTAESSRVLLNVCRYVDKRIHTPKKPLKNAKRVLGKYIADKVIGKVTDAAKSNVDITHLLSYDTIVANGRTLLNFESVVSRIKNNKQMQADLTEVFDCPIQGDLTVDNLIVNPETSEYLIIDPNNENAISDPIVDYSKLMQSVHSGYEFLYYLRRCSVKGNEVTFEERRSVQYARLYKALDTHLREELTPGRYRALLFHEAVHYCRMLTYRTSINPRTAAAFYAVAVRLFNDFVEQYEEE